MAKNKDSLESLSVITNLLNAYATFLEEVIQLEEEKGIQLLKGSFENMPKVIAKINEKDQKLGNRVAIWSIKVVAISNNLSKIQTLTLKQKKELVSQIKSISQELIEIKNELDKWSD